MLQIPTEIQSALARRLARREQLKLNDAYAWLDDVRVHGANSPFFYHVAPVVQEFAKPIFDMLKPILEQIAATIGPIAMAQAAEWTAANTVDIPE